MIELDFLGRSGDGSSIIFSNAEGERFSVAITDELRAAVKKQTLLEGSQSQSQVRELRPRDIQALLREGQSAAEIAQRHNLSLEAVTKYAAPILAEQGWAIAQAQQAIIGSDAGAPSLEDLVINRLAARGVDHRALVWSARRNPGEEYWEVGVTFIQTGLEKTATWKLSLNGTRVEAIDQEAKWLTETAASVTPVSAFFPPSTSTKATVRPIAASEEEDESKNASQEEDLGEFEDTTTIEVESLIEKANAQRGKRQPLVEEVEDESSHDGDKKESFFSARVIPLEPMRTEVATPLADHQETTSSRSVPSPGEQPHRHRSLDDKLQHVDKKADSQLSLSLDIPQGAPASASKEEGGEFVNQADEPNAGKRKPKRRSVPSWDEIVFGAKHD